MSSSATIPASTATCRLRRWPNWIVSVKLFPLLAKQRRSREPGDEASQDRVDLQRAGRVELLDRGQCAAPATQAPAAGAATAASQTAAASSGAAQRRGFTLSELKITDGQIAITDYQKHQPRAVYDHIDVTLKDYAPGQPFSLDLTAHLPGNGSQTFRISGQGGPVNNADMASTPFKGTLKLDEVSLSAAQKFLNNAALEETDAVISGSTDLSNADGKMSARRFAEAEEGGDSRSAGGISDLSRFRPDRRSDHRCDSDQEGMRSSWDRRRCR